MKNRLERRKAKRLDAQECIHVSSALFPTTDGKKFFWFKHPEIDPPNIVDCLRDASTASTISEREWGFTMKVEGHTLEFHGPFATAAECRKDSERVICGDVPVEDGGVLDRATFDLIRRRTPTTTCIELGITPLKVLIFSLPKMLYCRFHSGGSPYANA
jgi:hypothetical protein